MLSCGIFRIIYTYVIFLILFSYMTETGMDLPDRTRSIIIHFVTDHSSGDILYQSLAVPVPSFCIRIICVYGESSKDEADRIEKHTFAYTALNTLYVRLECMFRIFNREFGPHKTFLHCHRDGSTTFYKLYHSAWDTKNTSIHLMFPICFCQPLRF